MLFGATVGELRRDAVFCTSRSFSVRFNSLTSLAMSSNFAANCGTAGMWRTFTVEISEATMTKSSPGMGFQYRSGPTAGSASFAFKYSSRLNRRGFPSVTLWRSPFAVRTLCARRPAYSIPFFVRRSTSMISLFEPSSTGEDQMPLRDPWQNEGFEHPADERPVPLLPPIQHLPYVRI